MQSACDGMGVNGDKSARICCFLHTEIHINYLYSEDFSIKRDVLLQDRYLTATLLL